MHILNNIGCEEPEHYEEPVDTMIQNDQMLEHSQDMPFDQSIDQTINDVSMNSGQQHFTPGIKSH